MVKEVTTATFEEEVTKEIPESRFKATPLPSTMVSVNVISSINKLPVFWIDIV